MSLRSRAVFQRLCRPPGEVKAMGSRMRFAVLLGVTLLATCLALEFDDFIGALMRAISQRAVSPIFWEVDLPCAAHAVR